MGGRGDPDVFPALPSGDQRGPSSRISGVLVRLITSSPSLGTAKLSHSSLPAVSCWNRIHLPSGDQVSPYYLSSDWANCIGHPPLAFTFHRFDRPDMSVVNTISLPSGDHDALETERVKYRSSVVEAFRELFAFWVWRSRRSRCLHEL
jgi:hypothetical protein